MASAQDIRRRIRSVRNIQQITKAMKMVAAARLRRAQERADASRPYMEKMQAVLASVTAKVQDVKHPLLEVREPQNVGFLVIGADKGLAGAYTSNAMKEALAGIRKHHQAALMTVGRKPRDYFRHRRYTLLSETSGFSEKPTYEHAVALATEIAKRFAAGELDEVYMVYTRFHTALTQTPETLKLLPIEHPEVEEIQAEYIFEPSAEEVLAELLAKYLETLIFAALLQSAASELGARMTAMGSATDNADELISKLTLNYNKVRQATITREISEIVGGAEALK